jgi:peptidoglycan/LPS O-acetylase OafA/YrhL
LRAWSPWAGLSFLTAWGSQAGYVEGLVGRSAYLLLPTRAWELLCGALLALASKREVQVGALPMALPAIGLGLILVAVVLFDESTPTPGPWTLLPVLGPV